MQISSIVYLLGQEDVVTVEESVTTAPDIQVVEAAADTCSDETANDAVNDKSNFL